MIISKDKEYCINEYFEIVDRCFGASAIKVVEVRTRVLVTLVDFIAKILRILLL